MGLESATYISDLVATNPASSDAKSQGDDHIRLLKSTLQATFPNVTGAVTKTHAEINTVTDRALKAGDTYSGTHDFTGAAVAVAAPTSGGHAVTKTYADNLSFSAALPAQAGHAGKYVTTDGTTASWATIPDPDYELLAEVVASNSATVDLEAFSSTYDEYRVVFHNVVGTTSSQLTARFKKSGSYLSSTTYYRQRSAFGSTGSFSQAGSETAVNAITQNPNGDDVTAQTSSGVVTLLDANNRVHLLSDATTLSTQASGQGRQLLAAYETTASALQGIRFYMSSGNINTGTFRLYGVRKA